MQKEKIMWNEVKCNKWEKDAKARIYPNPFSLENLDSPKCLIHANVGCRLVYPILTSTLGRVIEVTPAYTQDLSVDDLRIYTRVH